MKFPHILLATLALAAIVALPGCTQIKSVAEKIQSGLTTPENRPAVVAVKAEAASLLKTFVFTAGAQALSGANWADGAAAAIYATQEHLAADPTALNAFLGTYLPVDSTWIPVIDGIAAKLITGGLNTHAERIAALHGIAKTFNDMAAAQRAPK